MMDNQLEQVRDIWVNAFFTGNYEVLAQYEDEHFKVVYVLPFICSKNK